MKTRQWQMVSKNGPWLHPESTGWRQWLSLHFAVNITSSRQSEFMVTLRCGGGGLQGFNGGPSPMCCRHELTSCNSFIEAANLIIVTSDIRWFKGFPFVNMSQLLGQLGWVTSNQGQIKTGPAWSNTTMYTCDMITHIPYTKPSSPTPDRPPVWTITSWTKTQDSVCVVLLQRMEGCDFERCWHDVRNPSRGPEKCLHQKVISWCCSSWEAPALDNNCNYIITVTILWYNNDIKLPVKAVWRA